MEIQYKIHNHPVGFCNNLYYALNAYIHSTSDVKVVQIITLKEITNGIYNALCKIGLSEFINFYCQNLTYQNKWLQDFGKDFTKEQIENFIKYYILKSDPYCNYKYKTIEKEKCLALHIRNGDYVSDRRFNFFDRKDYLYKAINHILVKDFEEIHIFSDDVEMCKKQYHNILKNRFQKVKYITYNDFLNDFIELSFYKNKILWNSTFSFWTTFISDVIYDYTGIVLCPDQFTIDILEPIRTPSYWTHIHVNKN